MQFPNLLCFLSVVALSAFVSSQPLDSTTSEFRAKNFVEVAKVNLAEDFEVGEGNLFVFPQKDCEQSDEGCGYQDPNVPMVFLQIPPSPREPRHSSKPKVPSYLNSGVYFRLEPTEAVLIIGCELPPKELRYFSVQPMIYSRFRLGMWWKIMGAIGNPVNNRNINKTETGCYSILVTPSIETHAAVSAKLEAPQNLIKIPGWIDYAQIHPLALGLDDPKDTFSIVWKFASNSTKEVASTKIKAWIHNFGEKIKILRLTPKSAAERQNLWELNYEGRRSYFVDEMLHVDSFNKFTDIIREELKTHGSIHSNWATFSPQYITSSEWGGNCYYGMLGLIPVPCYGSSLDSNYNLVFPPTTLQRVKKDELWVLGPNHVEIGTATFSSINLVDLKSEKVLTIVPYESLSQFKKTWQKLPKLYQALPYEIDTASFFLFKFSWNCTDSTVSCIELPDTEHLEVGVVESVYMNPLTGSSLPENPNVLKAQFVHVRKDANFVDQVFGPSLPLLLKLISERFLYTLQFFPVPIISTVLILIIINA